MPVVRRSPDFATAAHLVDHVILQVPVRQWVLSLPIPLRVLLAAQPGLVTPVLQVVQRVVTRHLLHAAELEADEGHGGAVTLIQRFGSAATPAPAASEARMSTQIQRWPSWQSGVQSTSSRTRNSPPRSAPVSRQ